jgi:hypothetical protein
MTTSRRKEWNGHVGRIGISVKLPGENPEEMRLL